MVKVKEALEQVKKAESAGDIDALQTLEMDERVSVSKAAQDAIDRLDEALPADEGDVREIKQEKPKSVDGWTPMTIEDSKIYQAEGRLVGYNPNTEMGLLKEDK